jgi:acetolactate synthase-1/2/3 large subunit
MANGAQALIQTLVNAGVEVCFTNPGTSEMHFVAALDSAAGMRAVLCLFEGVATGAADGYARMAGKPAATLLHLGCGLGNGLANLHNARKGNVPVVNIVGDHATYHVQYDAQLQSDIETVARNVSPKFVRTSKSTAEVCRDAVDTVQAAKGPPGQVATLILPSDVSWGEGGVPEPAHDSAQPAATDDATVQAISAAIRSGGRTAILLGGGALRESALQTAARISDHSGVKLFAETFPKRMERGASLPAVERLAYLGEMALLQLKSFDRLVLVDSKSPVSFFAYPGKNSCLVPQTCAVHELSSAEQDATLSLKKLAMALGADNAMPAPAPPRSACGPARQEAHGGEGVQGRRPSAAGKSHFDRRGYHLRPHAFEVYRRRAAARFAVFNGGRDRTGSAERDWGCDRLSGSSGSRTDRRRQLDVHDPVVVDDGARKSERHRNHLQ